MIEHAQLHEAARTQQWEAQRHLDNLDEMGECIRLNAEDTRPFAPIVEGSERYNEVIELLDRYRPTLEALGWFDAVVAEFNRSVLTVAEANSIRRGLN